MVIAKSNPCSEKDFLLFLEFIILSAAQGIVKREAQADQKQKNHAQYLPLSRYISPW
jgi:hypothetical protein